MILYKKIYIYNCILYFVLDKIYYSRCKNSHGGKNEILENIITFCFSSRFSCSMYVGMQAFLAR